MFTTASERGSTTEELTVREELSTLLVLDAAAAAPEARMRRPGKVDLLAEAMVRTPSSMGETLSIS